MVVHKKRQIKPPADAKAMAGKKEKPKGEIIVSDVITETTESIQVVETTPVVPTPEPDLLSDFKEKMVEEEQPAFNSPQRNNYMWPILLIFIIAILLLIGVFLYKQGVNINGKIKINVVTLTPTPTFVPEPTKTIDLSKFKIEILNGSGIDGEAGRQKDNLDKEGFVISSVGNADNSDFTNTVVKAKKEVDKDFLSKLKSVLETSFTVGDTETLADDAAAPVVVILGTKK